MNAAESQRSRPFDSRARAKARGGKRLVLWLALGFAASSDFASAQLTTDQVPWERTVPIKDEVRGEMERSRIELGPVRVLPWIAVRNFGYNDNIYGSSEDPVGDWIATVGAGARLYVPVGSKTFLRMDALPEYTWYKHLGSRNQFGGRAQAQYLMFFNRLSADLTASYTDDPVSILSSEVPATVERIGWDGKANVELDVTHRISIFAGAEVLRERIHEPSGAPPDFATVQTYDRTDGVARAGVRYRFSPGWDVSLAAEETQTKFVITPELRNNRSTAGIFGLHYDRPRFFANLYAGYRRGRALDESAFPEFETGTGSAYFSYTLTRNVDLSLFGARRLAYGSSVEAPYYIETRYGGGVSFRVFSKLSVQAFGTSGTNDYTLASQASPAVTARKDDVSTYGGGLTLSLWRTLNLTAGVTRNEFNANIPGHDRAVTTFTTGLSFGAEYSR
jgi:hypothetical protein